MFYEIKSGKKIAETLKENKNIAKWLKQIGINLITKI